MNGTGKLRRGFLGLAILVACVQTSLALDPSLDISQYAHTAWKIRDGFTKGSLWAIAQTPDGYLWLGTDFGLVRFDGVRAVEWQPPDGQKLPPGRVRALLAARDGTLWIGTQYGLASYRDGKVTQYPSYGRGALILFEDRDGIIWVGSGYVGSGGGMLCSVQNGRMQCHGGDGSLGDGIGPIYEAPPGDLWLASTAGLWHWKPGPPKFYPIPAIRGSIYGLAEGDDNSILLTAEEGVFRFANGRAERYPLPDTLGEFHPLAALRDRDGGLWVASANRGLLHLHAGQVDKFGYADGLSGNFVTYIFEDREGNIWATTIDGLDRFRGLAVPTISVNQGLSNSSVLSILAARDGSLWLGTLDGVDRWKDGKVTIFRQREKHNEKEPRVREIADPGLPDDRVESIFEDQGGRLWVSTPVGIARLENGRFTPLKAVPPTYAHCLTQDRDANVWISQSAALFRWHEGEQVQRISWESIGRRDHADVMLADSTRGGLWLGFFSGGVAYFKEGRLWESYTAADGLGPGIVSQLQFDRAGALWAATQGGLSRIKNGRVATLSSKNGLPCDGVHWMMQDDANSVWLYMPCGLMRIAETDIKAWVADPRRQMEPTVFTSSEGVRVGAMGTGAQPPVTKTADGRIWFLPFDGVSVLDPRHLPYNKLPPPVHIEQITADGKVYDAAGGSGRLRLPPLVRDLTIDYTALSLVAPEKVHFRFKLEGQDKDWREVVNDREVQYSNLPPKHYRFRVVASNDSGVWNEEGAALDFVIPPAWYQTSWFRALCVTAFLALVWMAYLLRVRQLGEQEKKFREAVETMPALAFVARGDGHRTFVNRGWMEYTGMTVEQATGDGWQAAVYPDDLKRVNQRWHKAAASGEPLEYELRLRRGADGAYRWFQTRVAPLRDRRGKLVKWCGVANDIEDRKRAEQLQADLAHTNRVSLLGELAASIAHELKQPITGSMANARASLRWLKREQPDLKEACDAIGKIERDGTRANEIIDRLRALYKKTPPQRSVLDVNEVIGEMVVLLRGEANRHAVSIRTELATDVPKITGDRVQLQQVLMNLMLNGIEAMHETGGVLMLRSQVEKNDHVLISVSDTGVGLPADKADQIFNAFFTTKPQGSGMGLAISRSIVESHGGRLWASSNDGRGATFQFTLPVQADVQR